MNDDDNFVTGTAATATFSHSMDPATVEASFTVRETNGNDVPGTVVMNAENTVATFTPSLSALNPNSSYIAAVIASEKSPFVLAFGQKYTMERVALRWRICFLAYRYNELRID